MRKAGLNCGRLTNFDLPELLFDDINTGPLDSHKISHHLLKKYHDVFSENFAEIGCATSTEMTI